MHVEAAKNSTNATKHVNLTSKNASTILNVTSQILTNLHKAIKKDDDDDYDVEEWWDNLQEECRLMNLDLPEAQIRFTAELGITLGAFIYLAAAVREARFLGLRMFFENLVK